MNIIETNKADIYDYYAVLDELLALFYQDQQRYENFSFKQLVMLSMNIYMEKPNYILLKLTMKL